MENEGLKKLIRLPLDELKLSFAASCVEGLARRTGKPYSEIYDRMSKAEASSHWLSRTRISLKTLFIRNS